MSFYRDVYQYLLFPLYEARLRGRRTLEVRQWLEHSQWMSPEEIRRRQWEALQRLLVHAWAEVPYYRETWSAQGIRPEGIRGAEDVLRISILTKELIRTRRTDLLAGSYRGRTVTKSTGGSTGIPVHFEHDRGSYEWRVATRMRGYGWAGYEDGERALYIWGATVGRPPWKQRAKARLHHAVLRQRYVNSFRFTEDRMAACLRTMRRFRPRFLVAYTMPMYQLARFVLDRGIRPWRPQAILTGAEKLYPPQRATIEEAFGCPVFNTYGSREFMLIASECSQHQGLHLSAENLYVEVIRDGRPCKPGEMGEIVVTDLHNYGMPFIRYAIGDVGIASDHRCACGRGLPMLEDVEGRVLDLIVTPDGRMLPGEFFPHLLKEFPEVKQFQVVQEALDRVTVKLVLARDLAPERLDFLRREILTVLGFNVGLDLRVVDEIPLTASGKLRVTISHVLSDDALRNAPERI